MAGSEGPDDRRGTDHANGGENGDEAALRARLSRLSSALEKHQGPAEPAETNVPALSGQSLSAANLGLRVLIEFVSAVVVGTLIGWQIDNWAHTGPVFLIVFLMVGMAAGMLNIYRMALGQKPRGLTGQTGKPARGAERENGSDT